jgi:hypothetical protein
VWSERECGVKERGRERKINREKDKLRERVGREEREAGRERKKEREIEIEMFPFSVPVYGWQSR